MRNAKRLFFSISLMALLAAAAHAALGGPDGVVIPYAGRLELNGSLVSGTVDFQFGILVNDTTTDLCDSKTVPNVPVTRGEFALSIPSVLETCVKGNDVHLSIAVRQDGGAFIALGKQRVAPVLSASTSGVGDFHVGGDFDVGGDLTQGVVTGTVSPNAQSGSARLVSGVMKFFNAGLPNESVTIDNNQIESTAANNVTLSTLFVQGNPVVIGGDVGATNANRIGSVRVTAPTTFDRGAAVTGTLSAGAATLGATTVGSLTITGALSVPACGYPTATTQVGAWCMTDVQAAANQTNSINTCRNAGLVLCPYAAIQACDEGNIQPCNASLDGPATAFIRMSDFSPRTANGESPVLLGFAPTAGVILPNFSGVTSTNSLVDLPSTTVAPFFCCGPRRH